MQIEVSHLVKEYKRKKVPESMGKVLASMFRPQYEILRAVDEVPEKRFRQNLKEFTKINSFNR